MLYNLLSCEESLWIFISLIMKTMKIYKAQKDDIDYLLRLGEEILLFDETKRMNIIDHQA